MGPPSAPGTLGELLYASPGAVVLEDEWVDLVHAVAAGEQAALHALYDRAHRLVFTLSLRITARRETAEEVTLDVFHDLWRNAERYDPENGTVLGWIMNQARSRAIDRLRFDTRRKRAADGGSPDHASDDEPSADPEDVLALRRQGDTLRDALGVLTADERAAIEATFFGGLTHVEASERLQQPLGTVKTRIRSGLNKLRQALAPEGGNR